MPRRQRTNEAVPVAGDVQLSETANAVLGLLTFGPRSGYDLLKLAQSSIGFFWTPARSQVYSELRRLSSLGLVSEERVLQEDRPSKRVYSLTPEGEVALRRWVQAADTAPDYIRSQFLLKVFFGRRSGREAVRELVRQRRAEAERTVSELREIEAQIEGSEEWLYPHLTLLYGVARAEAILRWADHVLQVLEEDEEGDELRKPDAIS
jgi:PadR family transcriptional regulator, regulatory protein AphA